MNPATIPSMPVVSLLAFTAWTLALVVFGIGVARIGAVVTGRARPNEFPADQPHGSERYRRLLRAHLNCVENLPIFAVIVFAAEVVGRHEPLLDQLALAVVVARVLQSSVHIASGGNLAAQVRFAFFGVQVIAFVWMGVRVLVGG